MGGATVQASPFVYGHGSFLHGSISLLTLLHSVVWPLYVAQCSVFCRTFLPIYTGGGTLSRFLEQDWCVWLGRYAFSIFIVHRLVLRVVRSVISPYQMWAQGHPAELISIVVVVTMLLAILGYHCTEVPVMRYIKSR